MHEELVWILLLFLCLVSIAGTFWLLRSMTSTRKRSEPAKPQASSSALDVWRTEVDTDIAELRSQVSGLSSTLRRLGARESMRSNRSPQRELSDLPPAELKNALRHRYGITPGVGAKARAVNDAD